MKRMTACQLLLCGALLTLMRPVAAEDASNVGGQWHTFRGNTAFQGVAQGALGDALKLTWTFTTQGPVKSSAVIGGGRVYVGSDDYHVYALDLRSGEKVWQFKTHGPVEASPLLVDDRLYIGSSDGIFYALNAATGEPLWQHETDDKILGTANYRRVSNDDGESSLHIIVGSYDGVLYCFDAREGAVVWEYDTEDYIHGGPAIDGDRIVFGGCDAYVHIVSASDGKKIGRIEVGSQIAATAAMKDGFAYIGHYGNMLECVDLEAQEIKWSVRERSFPILASAAVTDDRVVFGSRGRRILCLNRDDGEVLWEFTARGRVESSPVICGDRIIVGASDGRLYMLKLDDGGEVWSYDIGQALTASPAVADGYIVIGSEDGSVYAFKAEE